MKIFTRREKLSVAETVRYLSSVFDEEVSEADIWMHVLEGNLRLSLLVPFGFCRRATTMLFSKPGERNFTDLHEGVYDFPVPPSGAERGWIVSRCCELTGKALPQFTTLLRGGGCDKEGFFVAGIYLTDESGTEFQLVNADGFPPKALPARSMLVFRVNALQEFIDPPTAAREAGEKPLSTTERHTLLLIVAALCREAKIDWQGKAVAKRIASATEEIGAPVSEDTVLRWLKKISDALQSRAK